MLLGPPLVWFTSAYAVSRAFADSASVAKFAVCSHTICSEESHSSTPYGKARTAEPVSVAGPEAVVSAFGERVDHVCTNNYQARFVNSSLRDKTLDFTAYLHDNSVDNHVLSSKLASVH
jgi:hypothetical protein